MQLMVQLAIPQEGMRICDPVVGSGGTLLECVRYIQEHDGNSKNLSLFGQEKNRETWRGDLCYATKRASLVGWGL